MDSIEDAVRILRRCMTRKSLATWLLQPIHESASAPIHMVHSSDLELGGSDSGPGCGINAGMGLGGGVGTIPTPSAGGTAMGTGMRMGVGIGVGTGSTSTMPTTPMQHVIASGTHKNTGLMLKIGEVEDVAEDVQMHYVGMCVQIRCESALGVEERRRIQKEIDAGRGQGEEGEEGQEGSRREKEEAEGNKSSHTTSGIIMQSIMRMLNAEETEKDTEMHSTTSIMMDVFDRCRKNDYANFSERSRSESIQPREKDQVSPGSTSKSIPPSFSNQPHAHHHQGSTLLPPPPPPSSSDSNAQLDLQKQPSKSHVAYCRTVGWLFHDEMVILYNQHRSSLKMDITRANSLVVVYSRHSKYLVCSNRCQLIHGIPRSSSKDADYHGPQGSLDDKAQPSKATLQSRQQQQQQPQSQQPPPEQEQQTNTLFKQGTLPSLLADDEEDILFSFNKLGLIDDPDSILAIEFAPLTDGSMIVAVCHSMPEKRNCFCFLLATQPGDVGVPSRMVAHVHSNSDRIQPASRDTEISSRNLRGEYHAVALTDQLIHNLAHSWITKFKIEDVEFSLAQGISFEMIDVQQRINNERKILEDIDNVESLTRKQLETNFWGSAAIILKSRTSQKPPLRRMSANSRFTDSRSIDRLSDTNNLAAGTSSIAALPELGGQDPFRAAIQVQSANQPGVRATVSAAATNAFQSPPPSHRGDDNNRGTRLFDRSNFSFSRSLDFFQHNRSNDLNPFLMSFPSNTSIDFQKLLGNIPGSFAGNGGAAGASNGGTAHNLPYPGNAPVGPPTGGAGAQSKTGGSPFLEGPSVPSAGNAIPDSLNHLTSLDPSGRHLTLPSLDMEILRQQLASGQAMTRPIQAGVGSGGIPMHGGSLVRSNHPVQGLGGNELARGAGPHNQRENDPTNSNLNPSLPGAFHGASGTMMGSATLENPTSSLPRSFPEVIRVHGVSPSTSVDVANAAELRRSRDGGTLLSLLGSGTTGMMPGNIALPTSAGPGMLNRMAHPMQQPGPSGHHGGVGLRDYPQDGPKMTQHSGPGTIENAVREMEQRYAGEQSFPRMPQFAPAWKMQEFSDPRAASGSPPGQDPRMLDTHVRGDAIDLNIYHAQQPMPGSSNLQQRGNEHFAAQGARWSGHAPHREGIDNNALHASAQPNRRALAQGGGILVAEADRTKAQPDRLSHMAAMNYSLESARHAAAQSPIVPPGQSTRQMEPFNANSAHLFKRSDTALAASISDPKKRRIMQPNLDQLGPMSIKGSSDPGGTESSAPSATKAGAVGGTESQTKDVDSSGDELEVESDDQKGLEKDGPQEKCPHCDQLFGRKSNMRRHVMMVHEKKRPFVCQDCGAQFGTESNLKRHVATKHVDNKPRPFVCPDCGKRFNQNSDCRRHQERMHPKPGSDGFPQ